MVNSASTINRLKEAKVAVIGDMILDSYTFGTAKRVSPEAPVLVVNTKRQEYRAGGAGNVVLNLLSLGASVVVIGRLGDDWAGNRLYQSLEEEGASLRLLLKEENYSTPVKNRIIADNQQIVRVDNEEIKALSEPIEQLIIDNLSDVLKDVSTIALSDYGKGFLSPTLLNAIYQFANDHQITVITDPKGSDFSKYRGTTLIKPNLSEAYEAANLPRSASLEEVAASILSQTKAEMLMITRSEEGISIFGNEGGREDFPVHSREVKDVTGAGDSVLAMLTYALANHFSYSEATDLCNIAGSIAIEQVGCAKITLSDIAWRLLEKDGTQKIFDDAHTFLVEELLKKTTFEILVIDQAIDLSLNFFKALKNLHGRDHKSILFFPLKEEELLAILASLAEIDFIVTDFRTVESLVAWKGFRELYIYDPSAALFKPGKLDDYFGPKPL